LSKGVIKQLLEAVSSGLDVGSSAAAGVIRQVAVHFGEEG
jgi:hypothetical protein